MEERRLYNSSAVTENDAKGTDQRRSYKSAEDIYYGSKGFDTFPEDLYYAKHEVEAGLNAHQTEMEVWEFWLSLHNCL